MCSKIQGYYMTNLPEYENEYENEVTPGIRTPEEERMLDTMDAVDDPDALLKSIQNSSEQGLRDIVIPPPSRPD